MIKAIKAPLFYDHHVLHEWQGNFGFLDIQKKPPWVFQQPLRFADTDLQNSLELRTQMQH